MGISAVAEVASQGREVPPEAYDLGTSLTFGQLWESTISGSHGNLSGRLPGAGEGIAQQGSLLGGMEHGQLEVGACTSKRLACHGWGLWALWAREKAGSEHGPGWDKVLGDPHVLLTIPSVKVNIQGQRKAALTHIYIKNKSLNYLSSFAWGLSFYVPAPLRSISVRIKSYSPLGYVCGVVKNTDAKLTGCGTQQLIELIMTRSDLFLISNYVHLGCAGYMILVLMTAPVVGLSSRPLRTQDYKWGGKGHCLTPQMKLQGLRPTVSLMACRRRWEGGSPYLSDTAFEINLPDAMHF